MSKSISKKYAKQLAVPDADAAARLGLSCPKFSERLEIYQGKGIPNAHQLAEREHLINLRKQFPRHLISKYPDYKKDIGSMLRTDSTTKNKGGFAAPYTLD